MKLFLWLIIFIILFLIWVRYLERHSVYFPMREVTATPALLELPYEEIYFQTSDNKRLNGWFIPNDRSKFTVIFCHGNGGNIGHRLEKIQILHNLGADVFIFDYRGYGKSEGRPSEIGLYQDAVAAYDYLIKVRKVSKAHIILYGESLGGAVAIDLAQKVNAQALITEDVFTSVKDMAKVAYPLMPNFILSTRFDSISKIKKVTCPKLFIHSIDDEIVPFYLGERLYNAARPPKTFLKIRGGHNTAFLDSKEQFKEGIKSFLCEVGSWGRFSRCRI